MVLTNQFSVLGSIDTDEVLSSVKSNGNRSRVSNDREVLTPARVRSFVSIWEQGAHKGSSENARKAFDEMPKSVSGEDKVTLGDPEGSEG
ncbi:hypothetical protein U1Q18_038985 [Sarracenia purpurea var. burkii]